MAQHDYVIANGTGAAVRSDLNNALAAIVSQNSGATAPATTYAFQFWADTTTGLLKLRNSANSAWVTLFQLDGEWSTLPVENGTAAAPSIYFKDSGTDTGFYSPGTDQVGISTAGTSRLTIDANGNLAVDTNTLYVDAPNNRVGIGTSSPATLLDLSSTTAAKLNLTHPGFGIATLASDSTGALLFQADEANTQANTLMQFKVDGTERMRLDSSGRLGIGTTTPNVSGFGSTVATINVATSSNGGLELTKNNVAAGHFTVESGASNDIRVGAVGGSAALTFQTGGNERGRFDSSGRLLVGTSTAPTVGVPASATFVVQGYAGVPTGDSLISLQRGQAPASISSGSQLGAITFGANDGSPYAQIHAATDGTGGTNDYPGRLVFSTTADGASSPTERMRIDSTGAVLIGKTTSALNTAGMFISSAGEFNIGRNGDVASFNRIATDGTIVRFFQDATEEGTISVSGTTVSYNGAHLSRWSQLPSGAERTEILRGSVLSNIDEMCEWGDEENEQLNRMKISDVEGDKNVSGVFQAWDDDDDTYTDDFYCAMTGDFIIRIAQGVTVERGDLLMSAGDGTAKPQDDDIIRSKTIAKVTSTNVSCTYDDGSYCVPCVLMAC